MDKLDGMRTFVAVAEAGSFTAASNRLRISKKLVSKYVGQLEALLDVRLFHRTTRRLSLTSAGQTYYPDCLRILEEVERAEGALKSDETALSGVIRVTAPVSFGVLCVQGLLAKFRQRHPEVSFDLNFSDTYVNIAEGGFDLAIRIGTLSDSNLIARKLARTEFWAVASKDYLSRMSEPVIPSDLLKHNCIVDTNFRSGSDWRFSVSGENQRFLVQGGFRVNNAEVSRRLAKAGQGIALLPDYLAARDVASGELIRILSNFQAGVTDIQAVFLEKRHLPARVRELIDALQKEFTTSSTWQ